jgi:thymidine phosphorylase
MANRNTQAMVLRRKQEEIRELINSGYYKEFVEYQAAVFKAYLDNGFEREEALELLSVMIQSNQWGLEPRFCKGVDNDENEQASR